MEIKAIGSKQFYVLRGVPVVKSMVLNGKFLPLDELKDTVEAWNLKPVVFGHPSENGMQVSAAKESQLANHYGFITNASIDKNRMRADLYLEKEKLDSSPEGKRLIQQVNAGKQVDVSTAYFDQGDFEQGAHAGKTYTKVQREIAPDHLAILLDEPGACTTKDGCGINVNKNEETEMPDKNDETLNINAQGLAEAIGNILAEPLQKIEAALKTLDTNAASAAGSAQVLNDCMKMIKEMHGQVMKAPSAANASKTADADADSEDDDDEDQEDFETMNKKGKKAKKAAADDKSDKGEKKPSTNNQTTNVNFGQSMNTNSQVKPICTGWADYSANQNKRSN